MQLTDGCVARIMLPVSITLRSNFSAPVDARHLVHPAALAGCLWLMIAGLFGVGVVHLLVSAVPVAIAYAIPTALLAAFGVALIRRRHGIGLPLLSLILATALSMLGLREVIANHTPVTGSIVVPIYGGAIALSSAAAIWSARMEVPALHAGLGRRAFIALLIAGTYIAGVALAVTVGPLRGCVPIAPQALPSGATPGLGIEGVSGGAMQVVWGSGSDRVEQIVGLTYWETSGFDDSPTFIRSATIHGQPATIYRVAPLSIDQDLAFSWTETGCDRTVFLAPGTTPEEATEYASRY